MSQGDEKPPNVMKLPIRVKDPKRLVALAPPGDCPHRHSVIDEKLAEVECADCGAKLNPLWLLGQFARQLLSWEWEQDRIVKARQQLEERRRCRCTKCGEWTEIRRVGKWELGRLRAASLGTS